MKLTTFVSIVMALFEGQYDCDLSGFTVLVSHEPQTPFQRFPKQLIIPQFPDMYDIKRIIVYAEFLPSLEDIIFPEELGDCDISIINRYRESFTLKYLKDGVQVEGRTIYTSPTVQALEDDDTLRHRNTLGENVENAVSGSGRNVSYLNPETTGQIFLPQSSYWGYCPSCTLF